MELPTVHKCAWSIALFWFQIMAMAAGRVLRMNADGEIEEVQMEDYRTYLSFANEIGVMCVGLLGLATLKPDIMMFKGVSHAAKMYLGFLLLWWCLELAKKL